MQTEELAWIERIKNGDMRAFDLLYDRHFRRVYAICYRFCGHQGEAEEHAQDIFIRVYDKASSFRGDAKFSSWIYRLAINHMNNALRKKRISTVASASMGDPMGPDPTDALRLALKDAVAGLPAGYRSVFVLHDHLGMTHAEIADVLGCSPGNSKSQLARARAALRRELAPRLKGHRYEEPRTGTLGRADLGAS